MIGLVLGALVGLAPAEAHSGACTTAEPEGVTVVIDYQGLGGGVTASCALGLAKGSTGRAALAAVGASTQGTVHDGDGFVCRLNGRPGPSEVLSLPSGDYRETCEATPPADAYWSYWSAEEGGGWTYSTSGAGQHRVKLGGFEGWSFNLGGSSAPAPRFTPTKAPAPAPPPAAGGGSQAQPGTQGGGADGGAAVDGDIERTNPDGRSSQGGTAAGRAGGADAVETNPAASGEEPHELTDPAKRVLSGPPSVINSASSAHSPPASSPSSVTAQTNRTQRGMVYALLSGIGGLIVLGALGWRWRRRQTQSESESPPISES